MPPCLLETRPILPPMDFKATLMGFSLSLMKDCRLKALAELALKLSRCIYSLMVLFVLLTSGE